MSDEKKYTIQVKTQRGVILTYTLTASQIKTENGVHIFTDPKTNREKKFGVNNCDIEEVA